jgi:hypothetical protein
MWRQMLKPVETSWNRYYMYALRQQGRPATLFKLLRY